MKNIFVGNLDFNTSEEELRQMFEAHGQVDRVSIMTDRDTGRSRGFGFVEMTNAEEGDKAIAALNGTQVGGRTLNVNEARPKVERGGGGGGRDRGGSRRWRRWRRWPRSLLNRRLRAKHESDELGVPPRLGRRTGRPPSNSWSD